MKDRRFTSWTDLDERIHAERNARRCTATDTGHRCQLKIEHPGWPHIHYYFEEGAGRHDVTVMCWQWETGQPGSRVSPPDSGPVPPWEACLSD